MPRHPAEDGSWDSCIDSSPPPTPTIGQIHLEASWQKRMGIVVYRGTHKDCKWIRGQTGPGPALQPGCEPGTF